MNQRIQELAKQAGIIYGSAVDYFYTRATDGVTSDQMDKFAELIVRECVEVVNDFGEDVENGDIFRDRNQNLLNDIQSNHLGPLVWAAAEHIKKHFGVE